MKIFSKIFTALLMATPLLWQSCADESFRSEGLDSDFQGISVSIPYVEDGAKLSPATKAALTRAGQLVDFEAEEAKINQLYLFAFANGYTGVSKAMKVDAAELASWTNKGDYKVVNMKLEIGEYHVYALANVDLPDYASMTEEEVRDLDIASVCGSLPDFSNGLPMAACPTEIAQNSVNNYVKVEQQSNTQVTADMKFAVSKVRVSVVNSIDNFTVTDLNVKDIADRINLFLNDQNGLPSTSGAKSVKTLGAYYELPAESNGKFDVDNLGSSIGQNPTDPTKWVWQATFYVPESRKANTTKMNLSISSPKEKDFYLGEKNGSNYTVNRSQYYRYYIEPNSGQVALEVSTWKPESILANLSGPVYLNVDKTDMGTISGTDKGELKFSSNVLVGFESPEFGDTGMKVFLYEAKTAEDGSAYFEVTVNPALGIRTEEEMKDYNYFYLNAGPLKKKITAIPDLAPYLTVTPESYTVVMKEIANEVEYQVEYSYSTNLEKLVYEFGNGNNDKTESSDLLYYKSTEAGTDSEQTRPGSGANLGNNGRIIVRFNEPYNPTKFQKESNIVYTYTATGAGHNLSETVKLNIIPNLNGYRLWFRDVSDSWDNVHVYIYQPLQWNNNGQMVDVKCFKDGDDLEDAILYSITGKKTFKGWDVCNIKPGWGDWNAWAYGDLRVFSYRDGGGFKCDDRTDFYYQTDFLEDWRKDLTCDKCKPSSTEYARVWPGIQMKKDKDPNSPQYKWWYIELPPVCEPGKALIMFTRGHEEYGNNLGYDNRYPGHQKPGVPLYDYPDREGWMKYDPSKTTKNEFVDDQPSFENTPTPPTPSGEVKTLYVYKNGDSANWGTLYAYCWADGQGDNGWPGKVMTKISANVWKVEVASKYNMVIFNQGNNTNQSQNLSIRDGGLYYGNNWGYDAGNWNSSIQ